MQYWELIVQVFTALFVFTFEGSTVLRHSIKHFVIFISHMCLLPILLRTHHIVPLIWYSLVAPVFLFGSFVHVLTSRYSMVSVHTSETILNIAQLMMSICIEALFIQDIYDAALFRFITFCIIFTNAIHKACIPVEYEGDVDHLSLTNHPFSLASYVVYSTIFLYIASLFPNILTLSIAGLSGVGFLIHRLFYEVEQTQGTYITIKNKIDFKGWDTLEPIDEIPDGRYRLFVYTAPEEFNYVKALLLHLYNFINDWYLTKNQDIIMFTGKIPFMKPFTHIAKNITSPSSTDYTIVIKRDDETKQIRKVKDRVYMAKVIDTLTGSVKMYNLLYDVDTIDTTFNDV